VIIAPEYALDEMLVTASDMYSLGCLIYAVHCKGNPPFKTRGSLSGLRESAGRSPPGMERWDTDLQGASDLTFSLSYYKLVLHPQLCLDR
jgi:SCY1-like protein 2